MTTTTDERLAELRERAAALGFVLAARCRYCDHPLWAHRSVKDQVGPVCRKRHKDSEEVAA